MTNIYRRIYEKHNGPIPYDENNRSYEIHHIDKNRENNKISNLKCVSIQEHYDIHYQQGDWGACYLIARKMKLDPITLSELSSKTQIERVKENIHPWQDKEWHKQIELEKVANGTHPFLGGEISRRITKQRLEDGTHNFIGNTNSKEFWQNTSEEELEIVRSRMREAAKIRVDNGTHPFVGSGDMSRKRNKQLLEEGTHYSQIEHTCPHCGFIGNGNSMKRWHFDNCRSR